MSGSSNLDSSFSNCEISSCKHCKSLTWTLSKRLNTSVFFSVMNDAVSDCSVARAVGVLGKKGSLGKAGVEFCDALLSRVGGRRASGGNCGSGVVGAGLGIWESYMADRVVARESVDFLGLRRDGGFDRISASSELELA